MIHCTNLDEYGRDTAFCEHCGDSTLDEFHVDLLADL